MKNTKLSLADLGETKLGQWATLAIFAQKILISVDGDEIKGARRLWDAASQREDWGIEMAQFFLRELKKGMVFSDRSSAPTRVEDEGQPKIARERQHSIAPSSPQPTWSTADTRPGTKEDRGKAGHWSLADRRDGRAQPSRETIDGGRGQITCATEGRDAGAPSASPRSLLGHNKPPKIRTEPAFDPAKLIEATVLNKKQAASWYLSDGKVATRLPMSELLVRARDGVDCRILFEACAAKYANPLEDPTKTPEDLLTADEISICRERAKRSRATALESAV